jgi:hypothetical protein
MLYRAILACAVLLLLVSSGQARPKKLVFTGKCLCNCLVSETTIVDVLYSNQLSCLPLENKTCNVEVAGVIRSGSLASCEKIMREVDVRGLSSTSPGVSKPKFRLPRTQIKPSQ